MSGALEATGLARRFGKKWALRDCSFELPQGSVAGLVGPNGAGKTTLLHIAVGLLKPTSGSITVLGKAPAQDRDTLAKVGFVAQDMPLYKSFPVRDLIAYGAHMNPRFDTALVHERIDRLEIPLEQEAGSLSGGQRAQVALALALAKHPEILLLDEPLASLDPFARREFLQTLMESVADEGVTVVLSSHLLTDLERVCDHMMVLAGGKFRLIGDTHELMATHRVLIGSGGRPSSTAGVAEVLSESRTDRQTTLLVRTNGSIADPTWMVQEPSLEDIVLTYLDPRSASEIAGELQMVPTEVAR